MTKDFARKNKLIMRITEMVRMLDEHKVPRKEIKKCFNGFNPSSGVTGVSTKHMTGIYSRLCELCRSYS